MINMEDLSMMVTTIVDTELILGVHLLNIQRDQIGEVHPEIGKMIFLEEIDLEVHLVIDIEKIEIDLRDQMTGKKHLLDRIFLENNYF